ncbi:Gfo/Idh/MocA family oxidoreductase [Alsobacter sp. KACC 23698]|uniref:Gfo/Idh/MocA family oxidoreductase n=1 Tax=Alsobacter sp. KACC 23698 TaxID=3149229 RepID=A0AAU7JF37_9HYPH
MTIDTSRRTFTKTAALVGLGGWAASALPMRQAAGAPGGAGSPDGAPVLAAAPAEGAGGSDPIPLAPPDRQPPDLKIPEAKRKIGFAVVGLGELALAEIMPAFGSARMAVPVALVSGHEDKAKKVAAAYGVDADAIYDYDEFDEIADNEDIDVVYIVLPNHMHAEYTIRALRAGKHVLCEKPMAPTVEECERMIAVARETGRKLMIAYRLHYEPLNQKVMELCGRKELGAVKTFASSNCQDQKAPNIRLSNATAGGPLGDVGIYSINAARYVTGEEPVEVSAFAHQPKDDPRFREVPESVAYTMRFPSGALAHCDCSFGAAVDRRYTVHCAKGVIDMNPAFSYAGLRLKVKQGEEAKGDARDQELLIPQVNQFAAEMDHFAECVAEDKQPSTPGEEGLADMRVITALYEAIRTGGTVKVSR